MDEGDDDDGGRLGFHSKHRLRWNHHHCGAPSSIPHVGDINTKLPTWNDRQEQPIHGSFCDDARSNCTCTTTLGNYDNYDVEIMSYF